MNINKKLLSAGFKPIKPHKMWRSDWRESYRMVPDNKISVRLPYSNEYVVKEKVHPKSYRFYKMIFNSSINIWVCSNNDIIFNIWLEGCNIEDGVSCFYNHSEYTNNKNGILNWKDFLNVLPTEIMRDFILKDILK